MDFRTRVQFSSPPPYLHSNFDTIRIRVHFYTQMTKQRNLWGLKETISSMASPKNGIKIVKNETSSQS